MSNCWIGFDHQRWGYERTIYGVEIGLHGEDLPLEVRAVSGIDKNCLNRFWSKFISGLTEEMQEELRVLKPMGLEAKMTMVQIV